MHCMGAPVDPVGLLVVSLLKLPPIHALVHQISASVMALARLLYEFAPSLAGLVPQLLPAVLLLLRSKAREVIKSVLGFVKVGICRCLYAVV